VPLFTAPFQIDGHALEPSRPAAAPGADNHAVWCGWLGHQPAELRQWEKRGAI